MPVEVVDLTRVMNLRQGNVLVLASGDRTSVRSKEVKTKYVYVDTVDAGVLKFERTESVRVVKIKPTEAEQRVLDHDHAVRWLTNQLFLGIETSPDFRLEEIIRKYHQAGQMHGRVLDSFNLTSYLEAQAKYQIWLKVSNTLRSLQDRWGRDRVSVLSAVAILRHEFAKAEYPSSPLSRSTSPLANIETDLERWAKTNFLHDLRFHVPAEALDEEYRRLTEMSSREKE